MEKRSHRAQEKKELSKATKNKGEKLYQNRKIKMDEETKKKVESMEEDIDKIMLENRELDQRVEKLEEKNNGK